MPSRYLLEVCASTVEDCCLAAETGADRIELNSALSLGGLSPDFGVTAVALRQVDIPIIAMVRPRSGGFLYTAHEFNAMLIQADEFLKLGVHGVAFGVLESDFSLDAMRIAQMVDICHSYGAEAVFHRAFDLCRNPEESLEILIAQGVDRVLTSGQRTTAWAGREQLQQWQQRYGQQIELLAGSGIRSDTVNALIQATKVSQVHGSFRMQRIDPTSINHGISFNVGEQYSYDGVDAEELRLCLEQLRRL